ncbi:(2Fe-2S)-binding protein [Pseudonocardia sp. H11422]|uniref:(2Fe-2S)-binding protein n=1 Tax=Pseudonocardia sp. H11422 TaxID=2835866 RepID=UPI001BDDC8BA|nr:(2Fe-2S)-binding protein [Pseudonocardia sp. H11422]
MEHPLAGTLARLAGPLPQWPVRLGPPDGPGWRPYPELLAEGAVESLLAEVDAALRGGPALASQTLVGRVAGPVVGILAAALFAERRLPVLEPEQIAFRFSPAGPAAPPAMALDDVRMLVLPGDPAADHPGVTVTPGVDHLQGALITQAHRLFAPFVEVVSRIGRRGRRALWQGLADRIAIGFLQAGKHAGVVDQARAEADATLAGATVRSLRLTIDWLEVEHAGRTELFKRKSVCCLNYRSVAHLDEYCATCPLVPRERSAERLHALLATRGPAG